MRECVWTRAAQYDCGGGKPGYFTLCTFVSKDIAFIHTSLQQTITRLVRLTSPCNYNTPAACFQALPTKWKKKWTTPCVAWSQNLLTRNYRKKNLQKPRKHSISTERQKQQRQKKIVTQKVPCVYLANLQNCHIYSHHERTCFTYLPRSFCGGRVR